jgi:assimilatory nitrate reductase catalytic subunit
VRLEPEGATAVRTTCPYCGVGCGVVARRLEASHELTGDSRHPANRGRLCSKGSALADTLSLDGRLLHPQVRGARVSWDRALDEVARGLMRVLQTHGPEAIALYVSGQLLTEDYYVANKLMKGFIGSANIDTNSRLCMASAVAGHRRAFGEDVVPGCYEDFELADLIVLAGSNAAWCHPVLHQRIAQAKERRPELRIVVIDPRRTATCDLADLHLPIRPGSDVWLFNGLLAHLSRQGCTAERFVGSHTRGVAEALAAAERSSPDAEAVARACGVDARRIGEFFRLFAATERVVTAFSQGINQSASGTDKVNSLINCHLLTGRIGRPGMGPFSLTGQPNAMGGREVGGMANMLAAHLELESESHRRLVQRFWASPHIAGRPGLKAVELFEAMHDGRIKAVWIMATNPVVSLPDADRMREALARCELVVVSDCMADTETVRLGHVLLPAAAWGEKDGTVTNSERRISRQRSFLPPPGEARQDWEIVCEVARRMGFGAAFAYDSPHRIFDEHARLSCARNDGARLFDLGGLVGLTREQYDSLEPVQWPVRGAAAGTARLFSDGRFMHEDGKARFVAAAPRAPVHSTDAAFPMALNTGRIRDQWHTMTRTGRAARLAEHLPEPFVDLHGQDALLAGVRPGELARVTTRWGTMIGRARTSGEIARGQVFAPIHWSAPLASQARASALVSRAVDPHSGEPEFKHTPARVEPFLVDWYGVLATRSAVAQPDVTWWVAVRGDGCMRYELAGRGSPPDWDQWLRSLLGATAPEDDYLDYADVASGVHRAALIAGGRLEACLYIARRPELPARSWLMSLFARPSIEDAERAALLAGRPLGAGADDGPLVCSCFRIGQRAIGAAIRAHGLSSVAEIGDRLKAGTSCGSCVPEIRALLAQSSS